MHRQVTGFIPGQANWHKNTSGRSVERVRWSPPKGKRSRELKKLKGMKLVSKRRSPKKDGRRKRSTGKCRKYLGKKIGINMMEYRMGRWKSPAQAIAVSYSETLKKFPSCKRYLKRKGSKSKKKRRSRM
jgi:hypothetical protein